VAHTVNAKLDALVHEAVFVHARPDAGLVEQVDRYLFDNAGPNTAQNIFASLPLHDDVIDAVFVQELAEQQTSRAGADNGDLGSHVFS
jgi:hypothetical protein